MAPPAAVVALLPLLAALAQDPVSGRVRQTAYARMDLARALTRDGRLLGFVAARNALGESLAEIRQRDNRWRAGHESSLREKLTTGECAQRLKELTAADGFVLEALVMDAQGALVCATAPTSDYWQGDEPKFLKVMAEGAEAFVDEPAFDDSAGAYGIQLSVPVLQQGRRIGAVALTLKVPRPAAATN